MRMLTEARQILAVVLTLQLLLPQAALGCCPVWPSGKPVVNADQTVVILWDAATKTEHFIRKASFKSEADDFGFLIPTPSQPMLAEAGNEAFPFLQKLTEPKTETRPRPSQGLSCGCGEVKKSEDAAAKPAVKVLEEKEVAGFHAVVLEANSADDLTGWLKDHGYAFSPEVAAWVRPYVELGWKITALKVAKGETVEKQKGVSASALRLTFQTDRPLFPYREPDSVASAKALGAKDRLLRIYFLSDARYRGGLTTMIAAGDTFWTGKVAWASQLATADCKKAEELLQIPHTDASKKWWLTEFEDHWPYRVAPGDLYFARDSEQSPVERDPIIKYTSSVLPGDVTFYALVAVVIIPPLYVRRRKRLQSGHESVGTT